MIYTTTTNKNNKIYMQCTLHKKSLKSHPFRLAQATIFSKVQIYFVTIFLYLLGIFNITKLNCYSIIITFLILN